MYKIMYKIIYKKTFFLLMLILSIISFNMDSQLQSGNVAIANNFIVLLTMTIDTKNTIIVARNNISDRINDYRKSLTRWAQLPYKVVVIENSGYGNPFVDILKGSNNIKYISIKIPHIQERGKGYGEAQTLKYAIDKVIKNNTVYIMKITGRYAPQQDLSAILSILQEQKPNVLIKTNHSEWFVSKRKFIRDFANFCIKNCDDRKDISGIFETQLMRFSQDVGNVTYTDLNINVIPTRNGGFNLSVTHI